MATEAVLTFDEAKHRYYWNCTPVPNVTSILAPYSAYKDFDTAAMETARQKGRHVHKTIELDLVGTLDEATLPEWLAPVLAEWRRFISDTMFVCECSERRVYHPLYRYAGTLDLAGHMHGADDPTPVLIDLKRSFLGGHTIGMQTMAYLEAHYAAMPGMPVAYRTKAIAKTKRFALRLREDSRYQMKELSDPLDRTDFLAALALHNRSIRYA